MFLHIQVYKTSLNLLKGCYLRIYAVVINVEYNLVKITIHYNYKNRCNLIVIQAHINIHTEERYYKILLLPINRKVYLDIHKLLLRKIKP